VREYSKEMRAKEAGMAEMSEKFKESGSEIYVDQKVEEDAA
jgi:hypothetical protein